MEDLSYLHFIGIFYKNKANIDFCSQSTSMYHHSFSDIFYIINILDLSHVLINYWKLRNNISLSRFKDLNYGRSSVILALHKSSSIFL